MQAHQRVLFEFFNAHQEILKQPFANRRHLIPEPATNLPMPRGKVDYTFLGNLVRHDITSSTRVLACNVPKAGRVANANRCLSAGYKTDFPLLRRSFPERKTFSVGAYKSAHFRVISANRRIGHSYYPPRSRIPVFGTSQPRRVLKIAAPCG